MEKKKKDQKLVSACNQESQTNEPQNKQDKAHPNVTHGPSTKISSPSHDNTNQQQQQPPIVQWSYTPQNATEQFLAIPIPNQAPLPSTLNQWQQLPHQQQGQIFAQSTSPFWQPQVQPPTGGGPLLGANVPTIFQTLTPLGTPSDTGWQPHPVVPGGTSSTTLVPNMCYQVGYPFPCFPGPWDPSSCLGQMHQLQHPYVYNFPGALGFSSATPRMAGCLASGEHSFQREIIRPPIKLSQKHQQLWEAQSVENVQLWSLIDKLQAEVSDYKDRLTKLEEEVSSLKQKVEEPTNEVIGTTIPIGTGQPSKRGRPKRSWTSVDALHESHPRGRGRKPALSKTQFESKSSIFEKVVLKKVEDKEIANHSTTTMAKGGINEKILNAVTDVSGNNNIHINQSNSMMSAYQGQVHQEYQGIQMCRSGPALSSTSGVKVNFEKDKDKGLKLAHPEPSQPDKGLKNSIDVSAKYIGNTGDGNLGWISCIPSQDSARDVLDVARQSFFHNGSFIQQGGMITPGWNFANEEDGSEELEDAIVGSAKDENEEEMENVTGSAEGEIGLTKDGGGCAMNNAIATSPKDLTPFNNW